jgi:protein involved in temperature-dependent protein secretion
VVERANEVERMDVDIRIEDAPDTISIQQEQFEVVAQLAQAQPQNAQLFEMVIELSTLRNKDKVLERLKGGSNPEQQQAMQAQMQAQQEAQAARVQRDKAAAIKDVSTAAKNNAEAAATHGQMMAAGMQAAAPMMEQAPA